MRQGYIEVVLNKGFPGSSAGKESTCNEGDPGSIPVSGKSPREEMASNHPTHSSILGLPCGSVGKESTCNAGDLGSISGLGSSPGGRHGNPLQYSRLENPHGQSLVGYIPRGHRVGHN